MKSAEEVLLAVADEVAQLLADHGVRREDVQPETSLVDDLGMDSMKFLDLTVALERRLGLRELPMQRWQDDEALKPGRRYTVRALAATCLQELVSQEVASL